VLDALRMLYACRGRSRWDAAVLRVFQTRRLQRLVADAYAQVPLHRRRFAAAGVAPGDVRTLADLARLPTMPKALLRDTPPGELVAIGVDPAVCDVVRTSGSTGMPLRILRGPREIAWHRVAGLRILRELGFRWSDRTFEIRMEFGPAFFVQRFGVTPKRWMSMLEDPAEQVRALVEFRPHVVCATASNLHELAATALATGTRVPSLRMVISDGEPLVPPTRALVARAFGTVPFDVYGLVELSNFAWECERHDGLHVSADTHLVEILGDDGPVSPGTPGRIVCTDLVARTMPIVRYETGDWGALSVDPCPCGRTFPRLVGLAGREGDAVELPNGRRLHWPYFHETFARHEGLERYQVIQEARDRLRIRVLVRPERRASLVEQLRRELTMIVPPALRLEFEPWEIASHDPTRKLRPVVNLVPRR
jgi:phenylacetate-CoA ligase